MNVAPAAAGNMQELRGKVPKRVAFINDWMDAAELCGNCQQQVSCQLENLYLVRAYISRHSPFRRRYGRRTKDLSIFRTGFRIYSIALTLALRSEVLCIIYMRVIFLQ